MIIINKFFLWHITTITFIDIIILTPIIIILIYLFYITFIKYRNTPCKGCAHAKACQKLNGKSLLEKYHSCENND